MLMKALIPALTLVATAASAAAPVLPAGIAGQVPGGFTALASVSLTAKSGRHFQIVALPD